MSMGPISFRSFKVQKELILRTVPRFEGIDNIPMILRETSSIFCQNRQALAYIRPQLGIKPVLSRLQQYWR